jgi:two-component system OmpR family response regulator
MITAHAARDPALARILLVDDEPLIRDFVGRALMRAGYAIDCASNGAAGVRLAVSGRYSLVILDLVMPDMDGRAVLTQILQELPGLPVLILSCMADTATKVECLELGAQDYLTKPFSLAELIARVRARLRYVPAHSEVVALSDARYQGEVVRTGDLIVDVGRLVADNGHGPVALTRLEFLLLRELMEHGGRSVPKDKLLASVWGLDFDPGSNVVDVCIRRLRSKLGFDLIKTVRGEGYQLAS